jgi:hypothetical protein
MATPPSDQLAAVHKRMADAIAKMADDGHPIFAAYMAGLCDAGRYRVISAFGHTDTGEPEPYTLTLLVDVRVNGEWRRLCAPRWSELGFDEDDVLAAMADAQAHPIDPDAD